MAPLARSVIVAALVLLGACGSDPESLSSGAEAELGTCRRVDPQADSDPLSSMLRSGESWTWIGSVGSVSEPANPPTDRTVTMVAQADSGETTLYMHDLLGADIEAAVDQQHRVAVLWTSTPRYDPYVTLALAIDPFERAQFLGDCSMRMTATLDAVAERLNQPSGTLISEFIARPGDNPLASALSPEQTNEQPPVVLNPETAPASLLESLSSRDIEFVIPEAWRSDTRTLCTRIAEGWNDCVRLSTAWEPVVIEYCAQADDPQTCETREVPGDGHVTLSLYTNRDGRLDVVLLSELGDVSGPSLELGSVALPPIVDGAEPTVVIRFEGVLAEQPLADQFDPAGVTIVAD